MAEGAEGIWRGNLDKLLRLVNEQRGFDASRYRAPYVERRLAVRLRALGLMTYNQYARHLQEHPDEYDELIDALTINVTEFFRDPDVYDEVARNVIPAIVERKLERGQRSIRIWSAGCATGEEPYSLAMCTLDALGRHADTVVPHITATDLDPAALAAGRRAEYDIAKLAQIPTVARMRYLDVDDSVFRMRPEVARLVAFRRFNLFEQSPINVMDLVFCRNVFIYFTKEEQEKALGRFRAVLHRGGYLVLGRSEKLPPSQTSSFELVSGRLRIYRVPAG